MEWDPNEPGCTRIARLMVASPEYVYENLSAYGKHLLKKSHDSDDQLENGLLSRNDPIITLGLARFCGSNDVLRTIYESATSHDNNDQFSQYYRGLRLACLSNKIPGFSKWRGFDFTDLINQAAAEIDQELTSSNFTTVRPAVQELYELLPNPSVNSDLLISLFQKEGPFQNVSDQAWTRMISVAIGNPHITVDDSNEWGPDLDAWGLQRAICRFLEIVPITQASFYMAEELVQQFNTSDFLKSDNAKNIIERWLSATHLDEELSKHAETYSKLCPREELACYMVALFATESLASTKLNSKIWGPNKAQILRCYKYGQRFIPNKDIIKSIKKDGSVCLMILIRNNGALEHSSVRQIIEPHMNSSIAYSYLKRLKQINAINPKLNLKPVTPDFYEEHDLTPDTHDNTGVELNFLRGKVTGIANSNEKIETKVWVITVVVALILYLLWK